MIDDKIDNIYIYIYIIKHVYIIKIIVWNIIIKHFKYLYNYQTITTKILFCNSAISYWNQEKLIYIHWFLPG
jgi:hypothetical protein